MLRIREAVEAAGISSGRLLIAGAGNANDLDLAELADLATELWLVDIDEAALSTALSTASQGKDYQTGVASEKVKVWIGDAGGQVALIDAFLAQVARSPQALLSALSELALALSAGGPNLPLPGRECMDVVVSQCILSQILWPVAEKVWEITGIPWSEGQGRLFAQAGDFPYPVLGRVLRQLAFSHLAWLERLVRPGGAMLINSDIFWRGTLLYGANPLDLLPQAEHSPGRSLNLKWDSVQEWDWFVEESAQAVVQSVLIRRHI